ncbi:hypothetical protein NVP1174O_51 [Vibrio phage 1.174.O._10N.261.55.A8]|nr:hypothetical protein NVP1174O_51 [Vibrio phage 1.174.O._10N.261.55.A8]
MEIKKVGISKVRPLKDDEYISCDKCGECKTKTNQGYTRMMTDPDGELMVLHYIDQEVCAECGCEDLTVCDEQDTYFDSNPFVYQELES